MNTYTNKEWGYGNENPNLFAPTAVPNPEQWLEAVKAGGMRGGIAVVKHHDGFCLWPTKTTDHNVTQSGNVNAQRTNIPRDFAAAAKRLGMKYGFYVSPWDRNSQYYGDSTYVQNVFLKQCFELAQYGSDQFEMWFDGANGGDGYYGGANTKRSIDHTTYYDMPNLRDSVLKVCPNILFWGLGDEARWIGNEKGYAGETNWAYGSGETGRENEWKWRAGESNAKATDKGWFWHSGEKVKSAETLFKMYLETVGRNANLVMLIKINCAENLRLRAIDIIKDGIEDFCYLCKNGVITNLFAPYTATLSALHHSCARCTFLVINTQSRKAAKRSPASKTNASWLPLAVASAK